MRAGGVLFCKIHCPSFICFCKPTVPHLYNPGPLKLENTPHVPSTTVVSVTDSSGQIPGEEVIEVKEVGTDGNLQPENDFRKSCIRKMSTKVGAPKEVAKKKVQWMDKLGKELVEIKEFESNDTGDNDYDQESRGCVCVIL